jgi:repressor LexA
VKALTPRQQEILDFIRSFIAKRGMPPTLREIGAYFHITNHGVFCHLTCIRRKGYIEKVKFESRALRIVGETAQPTPRFMYAGRFATVVQMAEGYLSKLCWLGDVYRDSSGVLRLEQESRTS